MPAPEQTHYYDQFRDDFAHLMQDMGRKFEGLLTVKPCSGEGANYLNQFGETAAREDEDRRGDTPHIDVPRYRRWVYPHTVEWGHLMERRDFVRMMSSQPEEKNRLEQAGLMAMYRYIDRQIVIPAFFGDAKTGQNGATTTSFPSSQQISVSEGAAAATGMNLSKIRAALELAQENDMPGPGEEGYEQAHLKIAPKQNRELLEDYQVASQEFRTGVVVEGQFVREAYGVRIHVQNGLQTDSNSYRRCPLWWPSGMGLGVWEDMLTQAAERFDKKWNVQLFAECIKGATRVDEEKVIELKCAE